MRSLALIALTSILSACTSSSSNRPALVDVPHGGSVAWDVSIYRAPHPMTPGVFDAETIDEPVMTDETVGSGFSLKPGCSAEIEKRLVGIAKAQRLAKGQTGSAVLLLPENAAPNPTNMIVTRATSSSFEIAGLHDRHGKQGRLSIRNEAVNDQLTLTISWTFSEEDQDVKFRETITAPRLKTGAYVSLARFEQDPGGFDYIAILEPIITPNPELTRAK